MFPFVSCDIFFVVMLLSLLVMLLALVVVMAVVAMVVVLLLRLLVLCCVDGRNTNSTQDLRVIASVIVPRAHVAPQVVSR